MLPAENDPYMKAPVSPEAAKEVIRAYRAADSYVDWNMGRVIDELNQQGLADNTIIVILSDHGYHNGEKGRFGKTSSFDIAQQVPLIIYVPGAAGNGKTCYRTVQSLDIYPTLAALCGLPAPPGVQGNDISSLVHDPAQEWSQASYSMSRTGGTIGIGYTVRTENYCYTEWNGGKADQVLFDRKADPLQTRNLAPDPSHAQTVAEMKGLLVQKFGTNMPVRIPATEPAYVKAHHLT
jgi:arylsulfatase A-like enzyme